MGQEIVQFDSGGSLVCGGIVALLILIPYLFSIFWSYSDAEARGKSGCLVALLVALVSWPIGLFLWLIFRPGDRSP